MNTSAALMAIRPKTLLASLSPVFLGLFLAKQYAPLSFPFATFTFLSAAFMQMGTNVVNDYFDHLSGVDQNREGPQRVAQSGLMSLPQLKKMYQLLFTASFILAIPLLLHAKIPILILGLICILVAYCYTGGPFPLSHFGLGELLAFIFFGPIAVAGTFYIQHLFVPFEIYLWGILPGLWAALLMAMNNLRDLKSDQLSNKTTLMILVSPYGHHFCYFITFLLFIIPLYLFRSLEACVLLYPLLSWIKDFKQKPISDMLSITGKNLFIYILLLVLIL